MTRHNPPRVDRALAVCGRMSQIAQPLIPQPGADHREIGRGIGTGNQVLQVAHNLAGNLGVGLPCPDTHQAQGSGQNRLEAGLIAHTIDSLGTGFAWSQGILRDDETLNRSYCK